MDEYLRPLFYGFNKSQTIMETYRRNIENLHSPRSLKHFIIIGIFYILFGLFNFYQNIDKNLLSGIIWVLGGSGFIIGYFFDEKRKKEFYIELNNITIEIKLSYFSSLKINWNDIKSINIKPISITFELTSGEDEELSLGSFSYANVIEFKSKIKEFTIEKGITIK